MLARATRQLRTLLFTHAFAITVSAALLQPCEAVGAGRCRVGAKAVIEGIPAARGASGGADATVTGTGSSRVVNPLDGAANRYFFAPNSDNVSRMALLPASDGITQSLAGAAWVVLTASWRVVLSERARSKPAGGFCH